MEKLIKAYKEFVNILEKDIEDYIKKCRSEKVISFNEIGLDEDQLQVLQEKENKLSFVRYQYNDILSAKECLCFKPIVVEGSDIELESNSGITKFKLFKCKCGGYYCIKIK